MAVSFWCRCFWFCSNRYVNLMVLLLVAPFTMIGARFWANMARRVFHDRLINIFALLLMLIGSRVLFVTFF